MSLQRYSGNTSTAGSDFEGKHIAPGLSVARQNPLLVCRDELDQPSALSVSLSRSTAPPAQTVTDTASHSQLQRGSVASTNARSLKRGLFTGGSGVATVVTPNPAWNPASNNAPPHARPPAVQPSPSRRNLRVQSPLLRGGDRALTIHHLNPLISSAGEYAVAGTARSPRVPFPIVHLSQYRARQAISSHREAVRGTAAVPVQSATGVTRQPALPLANQPRSASRRDVLRSDTMQFAPLAQHRRDGTAVDVLPGQL